MNVTVLIVDDHEVVRLGLITLLEDLDWVEVVAEAGTAEEAVKATDTHRPDVVLMDIHMPGRSGIDACRKITDRWPETRVMMLTSYGSDMLIIQSLHAGACCYILKQVGNEMLINKLDCVRKDQDLLDTADSQHALDSMYDQLEMHREDVFADLTWREMQVLAHVAKGLTNPEIAQTLTVSEQTVCNDVNTILNKLKVDNRFEAAIFATRHNIKLSLPEECDG